MPLTTPKTRPQIQSVLDRLKKHESAAALPYAAWRTLYTLGISLGTLVSPGPYQLRAFCEDLKSFNAASILGTELRDGLPITLRGLSSGPGKQRAFTNRLCLDVANPQPMTILGNELDKIIKRNGLGRPKDQGFSHEIDTRLSVKIMHTKNLISNMPLWKRGVKASSNYFMQPLFDARELYTAYADTTWIENLPLDSICLHDIRELCFILKNDNVIDHAYEEIFRVSLSNPAESTYGGNDPDVKFVTKNPKTPFIISSDPRAKEAYLGLYPEVRRFDEQV